MWTKHAFYEYRVAQENMSIDEGNAELFTQNLWQ